MEGINAHTLHASFLVAKELTQPFTWAHIQIVCSVFIPSLKSPPPTITNVEIRNKTLTFFISKIEGRYICEQAPLITKNLGQKIEKGKPQQ